ncbi:hypothetical protein SDC9_198373 [bioreactor metagenome]|uniref:Uncharacterized protein n=1 Tax=bioreactor metagenome TaxID=1076179 RepID=A0A645IHZ4_9ZZZZ
MRRIKVESIIMRLPRPFRRVRGILHYGVGVVYIKIAGFSNGKQTAPDSGFIAMLMHVIGEFLNTTREISVGFKPLSGQIVFVIAQIHLHIFKTETRKFPVDDFSDTATLCFGNCQTITIPRKPADRWSFMTQGNFPLFHTQIGIIFQKLVRIAGFHVKHIFGINTFAG